MAQDPENIEAKLCAFIDGELDETGRAEIDRYLKSNPQYRRLLDDLSRTRELLGQLPRESAPGPMAESLESQLERSALLGNLHTAAAGAGRRVNRRAQLLSLAAMVVLAAGLGVVIYFMLPSLRSATQQYSAVSESPTNPPAPTALRPSVTPDRVGGRDAGRDAGGVAADALDRAGGAAGEHDVMAKAAAPPVRTSVAPQRAILQPGSGASSSSSAANELEMLRSIQNRLLVSNQSLRVGEALPSAEPLLLVVRSDDPAVTLRQVRSYLAQNHVENEPLAEAQATAQPGAGDEVARATADAVQEPSAPQQQAYAMPNATVANGPQADKTNPGGTDSNPSEPAGADGQTNNVVPDRRQAQTSGPEDKGEANVAATPMARSATTQPAIAGAEQVRGVAAAPAPMFGSAMVQQQMPGPMAAARFSGNTAIQLKDAVGNESPERASPRVLIVARNMTAMQANQLASALPQWRGGQHVASFTNLNTELDNDSAANQSGSAIHAEQGESTEAARGVDNDQPSGAPTMNAGGRVVAGGVTEQSGGGPVEQQAPPDRRSAITQGDARERAMSAEPSPGGGGARGGLGGRGTVKLAQAANAAPTSMPGQLVPSGAAGTPPAQTAQQPLLPPSQPEPAQVQAQQLAGASPAASPAQTASRQPSAAAEGVAGSVATTQSSANPALIENADRLHVSILGLVDAETDTNKTVTVSDIGEVSLPLLSQPVNVAGLTEAEAGARINQAYATAGFAPSAKATVIRIARDGANPAAPTLSADARVDLVIYVEPQSQANTDRVVSNPPTIAAPAAVAPGAAAAAPPAASQPADDFRAKLAVPAEP